MSLTILRNKLAKFQTQIDEADEREANAKHSLRTRDAETRLEKTLNDVDSYKRRIQRLERELAITKKRHEDQTTKLEKIENESSINEDRRKELEAKEQGGDERMAIIKAKLKEAKEILDENEAMLVHTKRKLVVLKRDIVRSEEKVESYEKRVQLLEEIKITRAGENLQALEDREMESSVRKDLDEERIAFLGGQLKEAEVRAESADRQCKTLERAAMETENEINIWVFKRQEFEKQADMDELSKFDNL